jgi:hypothetical protein
MLRLLPLCDERCRDILEVALPRGAVEAPASMQEALRVMEFALPRCALPLPVFILDLCVWLILPLQERPMPTRISMSSTKFRENDEVASLKFIHTPNSRPRRRSSSPCNCRFIPRAGLTGDARRHGISFQSARRTSHSARLHAIPIRHGLRLVSIDAPGSRPARLAGSITHARSIT